MAQQTSGVAKLGHTGAYAPRSPLLPLHLYRSCRKPCVPMLSPRIGCVLVMLLQQT